MKPTFISTFQAGFDFKKVLITELSFIKQTYKADPVGSDANAKYIFP